MKMNEISTGFERSLLLFQVGVVLIYILAVIFKPNAIGNTLSPMAKPTVEVMQAIQLATEYAKTKTKLSDFYLARAWLANGNDDGDQKWMVFWSPNVKHNEISNKWLMVSVDKDGQVESQLASPVWFGDGPPLFEPQPKIDFQSAVGLARAFATIDKDLSHYYIDRVWFEPVSGDDKLRWIVSWIMDPKQQASPSRFRVTVDMNGKSADLKGEFRWFIPQKPKPEPRVYTPDGRL